MAVLVTKPGKFVKCICCGSDQYSMHEFLVLLLQIKNLYMKFLTVLKYIALRLFKTRKKNWRTCNVY